MIDVLDWLPWVGVFWAAACCGFLLGAWWAALRR